MMSNDDYKRVMVALFKSSHPVYVSGGHRQFNINLQDVIDILEGYVESPTKIVLDFEKREMRFEKKNV